MQRIGLPENLKASCKLFLAGDVIGTTAYDISGSGNNGTLVNSPTTQRTQGYKGFVFNGSNQSVTFPNISGLRSFSATIYPTANTKTIATISSGNTINLSASNTITVTGLTNATVYVNGSTQNSITLNKANRITVNFDSIASSSGSIATSSFAGTQTNILLANAIRTETESYQDFLSFYI